MTSSVAAVIVTYNSGGEIARCLRALEGVAEVVVVDNASRDDTCRIVRRTAPTAQLLRNRTNQGYAAAVNQGIRATTNPFVLLLNPDTMLRFGLDPMVQECLSPDVGAVSGKLLDRQGEVQRGFNVRSFPTPAMVAAEVLLLNRLWPSNPLNRRYRRMDLDYNRAQEVDQPAGAFLMMRRDVLDAVGHLDENFHPLWFEDVDLCLRIRAAGYTIRYTPSCVAEHRGAHSLQAMTAEQRYLAWYGNLLHFVDKHFSLPARLLLRPAILAGLICRWAVGFVHEGKRGERNACHAAIRLVIRARPRPNEGAEVSVGNTSTVEY